MGIKFREASREDIPAIIKLLADDSLGKNREDASLSLLPVYTKAFTEIRSSPNNFLIVAVDLIGKVQGCAQLTFIPGLTRTGLKRATIEGVRIARTHRGSGIGEALMEHLLDRARDAGCGMAQLTTDRSRPKAHRFYERLGFEPSHIGMKKNL